MSGVVYLGCGSALQEAELWRRMLHRRRTRIVYWPFALPESMLAGADRWLRDQLDRLQASYELATWFALDDHDPRELDTADLLFVGGGNTFRLLHHVRRHGFLEPVRDFVANGGDYYGGSAGAVLAGDDISIAEGHDPNDVGVTDLGALGLVRGVALLPHLTPSQFGAMRRRVDARPTQTLIGLPEDAGLTVDEGVFTVVGAGSVHVLDRTRTRVYEAGRTFSVG